MSRRIEIPCDQCAHLIAKQGWQMTCDAFPDGIPFGEWDFATYKPCRNQIGFVRRQEEHFMAGNRYYGGMGAYSNTK